MEVIKKFVDILGKQTYPTPPNKVPSENIEFLKNLTSGINEKTDIIINNMHYLQHIGKISLNDLDVLVDLTIKYKIHLMEIFGKLERG